VFMRHSQQYATTYVSFPIFLTHSVNTLFRDGMRRHKMIDALRDGPGRLHIVFSRAHWKFRMHTPRVSVNIGMFVE
jgi:hypothetical protein